MRHLQSYKLFESRNWKSLPKEIYSQAIRQLQKEDSINNIDELFSFIDYWMSVSGLEYDPEKLKERLDWYYSSPPSGDEEWFPMWTSDSDTVEYIMNELSRTYADYSFKPSTKTCHICGNQFRQTNRHQSFCSSSCENEYDEGMKNYR